MSNEINRKMKTLKIDTGAGTVVLTYSEVAEKWDFFSGSQSAYKMIDEMCYQLGWEYDMKKKNYQANFVAENADKFVVDAKEEMTTDQLWGDDKPETMKTLKTKSEITSKNLKEQDCDYKGFRIGHEKESNLYIRGSHFNSGVDYFETIEDLKLAF